MHNMDPISVSGAISTEIGRGACLSTKWMSLRLLVPLLCVRKGQNASPHALLPLVCINLSSGAVFLVCRAPKSGVDSKNLNP